MGGAPRGASSRGRAGAAEAFLPAWDDLSIVDVVGNAPLESGDHGARGPVHALPQLATLGVGRRMRRKQHPVAKLAQRRVRRQRLLLEGIDSGAADAPLRDGAG